MKKVTLLLMILCSTLGLRATTIISSPTVSGTWTLAGSPYMVFNDITVDDSLTIEPGVEVMFMGYYKFTVSGRLYAAGIPGTPISFHAVDTVGWSDTSTTAGGWKGISINYYSFDSCSFKYCNVSDVKKANAFQVQRDVNMDITYCNFFHNLGSAVVIRVNSNKVRFLHCNVFNNSHSQNYFTNTGGAQITIDSCKFYKNTFCYATALLSGTGCVVTNNDFYENSPNYGVITALVATVGTSTIRNSALIKNNRIYNNTCGEKGAIACQNGRFDIEDNFICNNVRTIAGGCGIVLGGGAMFLTSGGPVVDDSTFFNVRNNVIANNYSPDRGGGIELFYARANIINNTFINNKASQGGAIYLFGIGCDSVNIVNNIFHGNISGLPAAPGIEGYDAGRVFFDHNYMSRPLYKEFTIGFSPAIGDSTTHVIDSFPRLVAPTLTASATEAAIGADFRLLATSHCIGMGRNSVVYPGEEDCAGNMRKFGGTVDIGAYEWGSVLAPAAGALSGIDTICIGTSATLAATVSGGTWSALATHATVTGGVIHGVTEGIDTILYTITDVTTGGEGVAIHTIYVKDCKLGVPGIDEQPDVLLAPNPTDGHFSISGNHLDGTIAITDMAGKQVQQFALRGNAEFTLDPTLLAGIYLVHIHTGGKHTVQKMIVVR